MTGKPRLTIVLSHPVQYFSPLFDLLSSRGVVDVTVAYDNDAGARSTWDQGFGLHMQWDIDLTGGHPHVFLTTGESPGLLARIVGVARLARLIGTSDVVVVHGYSTVEAVGAIVVCALRGTPFYLRADTSSRALRHVVDPRHWWPRLACRWSAGALAIGGRNARLMAGLGCRRIVLAPFSIDNDRFGSISAGVRAAPGPVRERWGVPPGSQVVAFAGKFTGRKRPGDLIAALSSLDPAPHILMIGDGPDRQALEDAARGAPVTFTGFLNQHEMPLALSVADVLVLPSSYEPWGLVINEALACGCVPVVSDAVGCAPDLVAGLGETYPAGDVAALAVALERALATSELPGCTGDMQLRASLHSLPLCASAYESAVAAVAGRPDPALP